jgi:hypothetical protein
MNFQTEIVKEVRKKIHYKRSDTFSSHIKTILQIDPLKYSGTVRDSGFVIWRYSQKCGIFYPVIHGELTNREGKTSCRLYGRLNIVGFIFSALSGAAFFLAWVLGPQSFATTNSLGNWVVKIGIGLFFGYIPILSIRMIYGYEKRRELKEIAEMISAASETGTHIVVTTGG